MARRRNADSSVRMAAWSVVRTQFLFALILHSERVLAPQRGILIPSYSRHTRRYWFCDHKERESEQRNNPEKTPGDTRRDTLITHRSQVTQSVTKLKFFGHSVQFISVIHSMRALNSQQNPLQRTHDSQEARCERLHPLAELT